MVGHMCGLRLKVFTPNIRQGFDPLLLDILEWSPLDEDVRDPALRESLLEAVESLPQAMREVVNALFWEQVSRREVARRYGISRAEVGRILEQALGALSAAVYAPD